MSDPIVNPITPGAPGTPPVPPIAPDQVSAPPVKPGEPGAPDTPPEPTDKKEPEPSEAEKRIKQLVAQRNREREEAAYWKGVAEGRIKTDQAPPAPTAEAAPNIEDFESYDDFVVAKAKYEIRLESQASRQAEAQQVSIRAYQERLQKESEIDPEILDLAKDPTLPVNQLMAAIIWNSEVGPKMIRYLNDHRDEAQRIASSPPIVGIREMVKIETNLISAPAPEIKKVSQAPEPIKPVNPKGPQTVDEEKIPTADWIERRNAAQFKRRK